YEGIRGPVMGGGPGGYPHQGGYSSRPRELSYNAPLPIGGGYVGGRLINLGSGGANGYIQPGALNEGPMTTVKILLPDGTTKAISIPARFLSNTVDEYVEGGLSKYAGPVADPFGPQAGRGGKYLSEPVAPALPGAAAAAAA
ncbi:hypothetical protein PENTCL1PPCAC_4061, partial [Pristionchus entomophagus]